MANRVDIMDEFKIPCQECANQLNVDGSERKVICAVCGANFSVEENNRYGIGGSPSFQSLYWEESKIIVFYLENIPLDLLDRAVTAHRQLSTSEVKPAKLIPSAKDYYDAIFKRIQDVLGSNRSELSEKEREGILNNLPGQGYNLANLVKKIPDAFSEGKYNTLTFINSNEQFTKSLTWLRNKIEHIGMRQWPTPSYLHTGRNMYPKDHSSTTFDGMFLKKLNNFVIDLYTIILQIDNREILVKEFENIEVYRI